ncbi:MAG: GTP-binding protein, partial [Planctomycetes bacterium]|nr:GTP-binding protein [Planctomycetota bacterium]
MRRQDIRNIAIIAHVDHGKTSLVDCLLRQSGQFRESQLVGDCILDSNELERERGITILAKNISLPYQGVKINIIDTPGHADFGGEVERVLRMADGALVLVDCSEGPMPQTRFVLSKALEVGLKPIVVINKIDRSDARAQEVLNETFELFLELDAHERLHDFPYIFATARGGYATHELTEPTDSFRPLLDMVLKHVPGPEIDPAAPLKVLVMTLDWSDYVGRIAIGRIYSGKVHPGDPVALVKEDRVIACKVAQVNVFEKLGRTEVEEATAGDIVALVGIEGVEIGDTISDPADVKPLPRVKVDEPTLEM